MVGHMERHYDTVSVEHAGVDNALEISIWDEDHTAVERKVRIPVEEIPIFLREVSNHAMGALMRAAERLEVGHCETCGNTRLVTTVVRGREMRTQCPDCGDRIPARPFANAPTVGRKGVI